MSVILDTIVASAATQRFLAEHPAGWTGADWAGYFGSLRTLFGELDEAALKERVLEAHLARGRRLGDDGAPVMDAPAEDGSDVGDGLPGLPQHLKVLLLLAAAAALVVVIIELARWWS